MNTHTNIAISMPDSIFKHGILEHINSFSEFKTIGILIGEQLPSTQLLFSDINILVVDINVNNVDYYESIIGGLKHANTQLKVLAIVEHNKEVVILKILRGGADAILNRNCCLNEFNRALHCLVINRNYFSRFVDDVCKRQEDQSYLYLSDLENRFISLCCSEFTYKEIADKLGISICATEKMREKLFKKFNVLSRTGLVMKVLRNGAVSLTAN